MNGRNIVIVGKGAREHALCWKLQFSPFVSKIFMIPGNGGTYNCCEKAKNVEVDYNIQAIVNWCCENNIYLVVIGPEQFLAEGICDLLIQNNIKCFGPSKEAARIEADKSWSKNFMENVGIPTASCQCFSEFTKAVEYIELNIPEDQPIVVKASGLASGKGVVICQNKTQTKDALKEMMVIQTLGDAGKVVLIEEYLDGEEVSILAFCDGNDYDLMLPTQDHKRLNDDDQGPNTGGMGAVCPYQLTAEELIFIRREIFDKAIAGMCSRFPFKGVLYAGLILTNQGIKVLEFNCRFGDPEAQVVLPLLKTDLFSILEACCDGTLSKIRIKWSSKFAVGIVMASDGYPISNSQESVIRGLPLRTCETGQYIFHAATEFKNEKYYAKSGRVLTAVALSSSLTSATVDAKNFCSSVLFNGQQFRKDIGYRAITRYILKSGSRTYKSTGVDISAGNELVQNLKTLVSCTHNKNVITPLGSFAAAYKPKLEQYELPLFVSGCDGVGTKLKIAEDCNNYSTIGQDLVAMCVNDILALGAEPLFFLDYIACGVLDVNQTLQVINGIVDGCKKADCALVGGETAEMPEIFKENEYELAGFVVGIVEQSRMLPSKIVAGDKAIYLPSCGVHSNGFSLIRKLMKERDLSYDDKAQFSSEDLTYGEEFLKPTTIYTNVIVNLLKDSKIKAFAHITGGGLPENVTRILPKNISIELDASKWNIQPVFGWIAAVGEVCEYEMLRTFNCGIGGIVIVSPEKAQDVATVLNSSIIGELKARESDEPQCSIVNFEAQIKKTMIPFVRMLTESSKTIKKVAVLISGIGSNLQALIKGTSNSWSAARIVLVISDKANAGGIKIAKEHNIRVEVIEREPKETREHHENRIQRILEEEKVEIICLAGYMKLLTESFVNTWSGKMLNVHPSLLPSFVGLRAQKQAIDYGVKYSGCTVHFVEVECDSGAIVEQAVVPVYPNDDEGTLAERIKIQEHKIFPKALQLLASGEIQLDLKTRKIKRNRHGQM